MPQVDPVILRLEAEVRDYNAKVSQAQRLTDQKLGAIEARGKKMGEGLKQGFDLAKGAAFAYISTVGVSTITNAIKQGLEYASSLGEVAQQLGVTTDALQEYRYAGSQAGLSVEETDQALSQLTRRLGEAASGTKAQAEAFEKLGISVKDASGNVIDAGRAIPLIAEALRGVASPAERAALLMDLFGRSGQKLEPLLSQGAAGVNNLRDAAQKLGVVLSEEQIQKADDTADKLGALKQVLEAKIASSVADNAGSIVRLADSLAYLIDKLGEADRAFQRFQKFQQDYQRFYDKGVGGAVLSRVLNVATGGAYPVRGGTGAPAPRQAPRAAPVPLNSSVFRGGLGPLKSRFGEGADANPFGAAGQNNAGALALLAMAPAQAVKAANAISVELEQLAADLASASAELSGSLEDRAEAERLRINADLSAEKERIRQREGISEAEKAQLILQNEVNAAKKREVVAAGLSAALAERTADAADAARDAAEDARREREAAKGPLARYSDSLDNPREAVEAAVVRKLQDVNDGIADAIGKAIGTKDPFIRELLSILLEQILFRPLADILSQAGGAGGGGGFGGLLASIGSIFGGGRAIGGPVSAGKSYLVGERGPEILRMGGQGGFIVPNHQIASSRSGGGDRHFHIKVDARNSVTPAGFAEQLSRNILSQAAQMDAQAAKLTLKAAPARLAQHRRDGF